MPDGNLAHDNSTNGFNVALKAQLDALASEFPIVGAGPDSMAYKVAFQGKYALKSPDGVLIETAPGQTAARVMSAIYRDDPRAELEAPAFMKDVLSGRYLPGGRIVAGAGTGRDVTLINCFVLSTILDSMKPLDNDADELPIFEALNAASRTMQAGGGIGQDFSTIRPEGAVVKGVGTDASGPLTFMDVWDAMCRTVMSAGQRRGAMMATIADDHPDVEKFILAKQNPGRLRMFNMSVLISNAFMKARKDDADWELGFWVPPAKSKPIAVHRRKVPPNHRTSVGAAMDSEGMAPWYVYRTVKARDLWNKILRNTYDFAEPGLIFIDRINEQNNLWFAEYIRCTNPCGEEPLPPNSICNLGALVLTGFVTDPYTDLAKVDFDLIEKVAFRAVRFHDNVVDVSNYPLPAQAREAAAKRRTGIGLMGLGNLFEMMRVRYGSPESVALAERVMEAIAVGVYRGSIALAKERGEAPVVVGNRENFLKGAVPRRLAAKYPDIKDGILEHGIRNGVLLTIAPTGTTSMMATVLSPYGVGADNMSSGIEPVFAHKSVRNVRVDGDKTEQHFSYDLGFVAYARALGQDPAKIDMTKLPPWLCSVTDGEKLTVEDHLVVQGAVQKWVDASISKTVNCPEDMPFDEFEAVYDRAYELGCKGCTTYRPNEASGRGSVLMTEEAAKNAKAPTTVEKPKRVRSRIADSKTARDVWSPHGATWYTNAVFAAGVDGAPVIHEVFFNSSRQDLMEMTTAAAILFSKFARIASDDEIQDALDALKSIQGVDQAWVVGGPDEKSVRFASFPSLLATRIEEMIHASKGSTPVAEAGSALMLAAKNADEDTRAQPGTRKGPQCTACRSRNTRVESGCTSCNDCGHSKCG